jgi:two-component system, OmpR family, response regulator
MNTPESLLVDIDLKKTITIFLVEDDKMFLHALGFNLHKMPQYKVYCYSSGEECLKNMDLKPQIIILDYYLNENKPDAINGLDVLSEIKKTKPNTTVIMLSGQKDLDIALNTLKAGAYTYLIKDKQTLEQLNELINQVIKDLGLREGN